MSTVFMEPGGDADFLIGTTNGFWGASAGTPTVATDIVNPPHLNSLSFTANAGSGQTVTTPNTGFASSGRISFYLYIKTLPSSGSTFFTISDSSPAVILQLKLTSAGVLQLFETTVQLGASGMTLATGRWYQISISYELLLNSLIFTNVFVGSELTISVGGLTITKQTPATATFGSGANSPEYRMSDFYIESPTNPNYVGDVLVTAKRPFSNGTTNGFSTQIGSGGSGYGSGHTPQVNERALNTADGWSMVGAGSAVTEEYNIEAINAGDSDISNKNILDICGWVSCSSLAGETIQIILNNANFSQAITSTTTMYKKYAGVSTYPSGTGTDIGIVTDTTLTTVSLYECGVLVAYLRNARSTGLMRQGFANKIRPYPYSPGNAR